MTICRETMRYEYKIAFTPNMLRVSGIRFPHQPERFNFVHALKPEMIIDYPGIKTGTITPDGLQQILPKNRVATEAALRTAAFRSDAGKGLSILTWRMYYDGPSTDIRYVFHAQEQAYGFVLMADAGFEDISVEKVDTVRSKTPRPQIIFLTKNLNTTNACHDFVLDCLILGSSDPAPLLRDKIDILCIEGPDALGFLFVHTKSYSEILYLDCR